MSGCLGRLGFGQLVRVQRHEDIRAAIPREKTTKPDR
jgi:hypothetical protein